MIEIQVHDDDSRFAGQLRRRILEGIAKLPESTQAQFHVYPPIDTDTFEKYMRELETRQQAFRRHGDWTGDDIPLDRASILVVDYDLLQDTAFLTGEMVAYAVRCFSTCGLVVGVNQYGENPFDLTLRGHLESFADLNVGWRQLSNASLWGGTQRGFTPWHWPSLPAYHSAFEGKAKCILENLDANLCVWQILGFPADSFEMLPRTVAGFLGSQPRDVTFDRFVRLSGNGLRRKDLPGGGDVSAHVVARVGAARISKWLERRLLPRQDILVDAPHLVSRYPSLLASDSKDIETWNRTAQLTRHEELPLDTKLIEPFRLRRRDWASRPVWFWDELRECEEIREVAKPWTTQTPDWLFCEDASRFYERRHCTEFVASTGSPYERRFARVFENVHYDPQVPFYL